MSHIRISSFSYQQQVAKHIYYLEATFKESRLILLLVLSNF